MTLEHDPDLLFARRGTRANLPVDEIVEKYLTDPDASYDSLAEENDVSPGTIRNRLKERGVQPKSQGAPSRPRKPRNQGRE